MDFLEALWFIYELLMSLSAWELIALLFALSALTRGVQFMYRAIQANGGVNIARMLTVVMRVVLRSLGKILVAGWSVLGMILIVMIRALQMVYRTVQIEDRDRGGEAPNTTHIQGEEGAHVTDGLRRRVSNASQAEVGGADFGQGGANMTGATRPVASTPYGPRAPSLRGWEGSPITAPRSVNFETSSQSQVFNSSSDTIHTASMPGASEQFRTAPSVPNASDVLRTSSSIPNASDTFRTASYVPSTPSDVFRTATAVPDTSDAFRTANLTPNWYSFHTASESVDRVGIASPSGSLGVPAATSNNFADSLPLSSASTSSKGRFNYKADKFNGTTDWSDYLQHFEMVAKWNNWSGLEKAAQLSMNLTGVARQVWTDSFCDPLVQVSYEDLVKALHQRFRPEGQEEVHKAEFRSLTKKHSESFMEFGYTLRRLAIRAFSSISGKAREGFVVDQFLVGLTDLDMRKHVSLQHPKSIDQAITLATKFDIVVQAVKAPYLLKPKPVAAVAAAPDQDLASSVRELIGVLTARSAKGGQSKQPFSGQCWGCQKVGHIQFNCPDRQRGNTGGNF